MSCVLLGMRPLLLLPLLLLVACGSTTAAGGAAPGSSPSSGQDSLAADGTAQADNDLTVEVDLGDGSPAQTWTLTCAGSVDGSHPQAAAACAHLRTLDDPFAPLPPDVICTEVYGGPQTAQVTGRWEGEPVSLSLARSNGCLISQWDALVPLVPAASGA